MALIKKIHSERVRIELGYWKIIDLTYNCNSGDILLSLGGFVNKEAREQDAVLNCLDSKKIILHTKKQFESRPVMRVALKENGEARVNSEGKVILEPTGEQEQVQVETDRTITLERIELNMQELYTFLATYQEFVGSEVEL